MPHPVLEQGRAAWKRFAGWRAPVAAGLVVALLVNVVLAVAFLWSRGGQTSHLRIVAQGSSFTAFIDGKKQVETTFDAPRTGGIGIILNGTESVPSLPDPQGVDHVRVTSLDSGEVLFEDDFSGPVNVNEGGAWFVLARGAELRQHDGVVGVEGDELKLLHNDDRWGDYVLEAEFKNSITITVRVRAQDTDTGVDYAFRPFRHLDNQMFYRQDQIGVASVGGPPLESDARQLIGSMLAMLLRPYPLLLALVLLAVLLVAVLQFVPVTARAREWPRPDNAAWVLIAALAAGSFATTLFLNYSYGSHMPHVPDELSYIFQAKVFARFHLYAPGPPVTEPFLPTIPSSVNVVDGKFASIYPFGHPLALAPGAFFGAIWIMPPLIGAACVALVFAIGRRIYGTLPSALAALLFAGSPFFLMTSSNFMSHNTAAMYMLTALFFLAIADRRPMLYPLLAGIFFGMIFNTRQLTGAALMPAFGVFLLTSFSEGDWRHAVRKIGAFAAGGLLMGLAYLLYRYLTTGDAFYTDNVQSGRDVFGFDGSHSVRAGIAHDRTQLAYLLLVLDNWPAAVGLMFVLLPFVLGTRNRWDWFFLLAICSIWGAYTWYYYHGLIHGPRFWYESSPLLMLLSARGVDRAARLLPEFAARLRNRLFHNDARPAYWAGIAVAYPLIIVLAFIGWREWLFGSADSEWVSDAVPARAKHLRNFNGIDDRLVKKIDAAHLDNALVLVSYCGNWQCYGNVYWKNSPFLDGDIVFARRIPDIDDARLFAAFPDRYVWLADYNRAVLMPYQPALPGASAATPNPAVTPNTGLTPVRADEIPVPTMTPTATPDLNAGTRRDLKRAADLVAIADALHAYYRAHGTYPIAPSLQSLCTYPEDGGCALREILDPLPRDPGTDVAYSYVSDGIAFTLLAGLESTSPEPPCQSPSVRAFPEESSVYCVGGATGSASEPRY